MLNMNRRCSKMAKCEICGKGVTFGIKVSHSHRRSNRAWKPNVKKVKAIVNGSVKSVNVCTRCLRSGKVVRAVWFRFDALQLVIGFRTHASCFFILWFEQKNLRFYYYLAFILQNDKNWNIFFYLSENFDILKLNPLWMRWIYWKN